MSKKVKNRLSRSQKTLSAGFVITLLTIFIIDSAFYAGVMNLTSVNTLIVAMIVFLLFNHGSRNPIVVALLAGGTLAFCMTMIVPSYTYWQAYEVIQNEQSGEVVSADQKNMGVKLSGFDVFAPNRFYRFVIEQQGTKKEYLVNPDSGEVIQLVKR